MTISWRVQQQYFVATSQESDELVRLPPTVLVTKAAKSHEPHTAATAAAHDVKTETSSSLKGPRRRTNVWTIDEHERFLLGLELYRHGPWKLIADVVGTKTTRQTMTHAQKYRQKIQRRQRVEQAMETVYENMHRSFKAPHEDNHLAIERGALHGLGHVAANAFDPAMQDHTSMRALLEYLPTHGMDSVRV